MNSKELLQKYCNKLPKKRQTIFLDHTKNVLKESLLVAKKHPEFSINIKLLKDMAMLHDIGVCELKKDTPYIQHGIIGKNILIKEGFGKIAKIAETHIGSGITKDEAKLLKLPEKNMLPRTIEEKIVCYADKFYSKSKPGKHKIEDILKEFETYGKGSLKRFKKLNQLFS